MVPILRMLEIVASLIISVQTSDNPTILHINEIYLCFPIFLGGIKNLL